MTSTVTSKGQTVIPIAIRQAHKIRPGSVLQWTLEGQTVRVCKMAVAKPVGLLAALRRFGKVPAAPRARRPVPPADEIPTCYQHC